MGGEVAAAHGRLRGSVAPRKAEKFAMAWFCRPKNGRRSLLESTRLVIADQADHGLAPQPAPEPARGYRFRPVSGDLTNFAELSIALTTHEKLSVRLIRLGKGMSYSRDGRQGGGGRRSSNAHLRPHAVVRVRLLYGIAV